MYAALSSALKTIGSCRNWWPGYQTLGRTQLGVGEVAMAIKSFSRAILINPAEEELWKDDLSVSRFNCMPKNE